MATVTPYKELLSSIVLEHKAFQDVNHTCWKDLVGLITSDVLADAHKASTEYVELFRGMNVVARPLKSMSRITVKAQGTRPDVPFKVNSDLCAIRVPTYNVSLIKPIMNELQKRVASFNGEFYIRNNIEDSEGNCTDIIQYAFAYIPIIGYIVEIQVGHPFAMYTFTVDSIIRDKRLQKEPLDGLVDFWDNDFYTYVKSAILNCSDISMDDFVKKFPTGDQLYNDTELVEILQKLLSHGSK